MPRCASFLALATAVGQIFSGHFDGPPSIPYSPAAVAAAMAILLAASIFATDGHRRINGAWAVGLLFTGLWQASVALAYWGPGYVFVRLANVFGVIALFTFDLIQDMILVPWRSLPSLLFRRKWRLVALASFSLVFTDWFILSSDGLALRSGSFPFPIQYRAHQAGPLYPILISITVVWLLGLTCRSIWLLRKRLVADPARREMRAYAVLTLSMGLTVVSVHILRIVAPVTTGSRFAPIFLIAGLSIFSGLILQEKVLDLGSVRASWLNVVLRGSASLTVSLLCVYVLFQFPNAGRGVQAVSVLGLAGVLSSFPFLDRRFRRLVDSRFPPCPVRSAEAAVRRLIETADDPAMLHRGFSEALRRWSDGSQQVLLSPGLFPFAWPSTETLGKLLPYCSPNGWITPDVLEHGGPTALSALASMIGEDIAALICSTDEDGNQLLAILGTRTSLRPFTARELRDAHRLLEDMQIGLAYLQASRRLRGIERLMRGSREQSFRGRHKEEQDQDWIS